MQPLENLIAYAARMDIHGYSQRAAQAWRDASQHPTANEAQRERMTTHAAQLENGERVKALAACAVLALADLVNPFEMAIRRAAREAEAKAIIQAAKQRAQEAADAIAQANPAGCMARATAERRATKQEKLAALVELDAHGVSVETIASVLGIALQTVFSYRWQLKKAGRIPADQDNNQRRSAYHAEQAAERTARLLELKELERQGLSIKETAERLGVSYNTVIMYRNSLKRIDPTYDTSGHRKPARRRHYAHTPPPAA